MTGYGKLRPIKNSRKHKPKPRYVSFRTGEQGWKVPKPSWDPSTRQLKALAILFLIVGGILGADQVSKVLLPEQLPNGFTNYDPFTLLWNGTITQGIGQGNSIMWSNTNVPTNEPLNGAPPFTVTRFAECFNGPGPSSAQTLNRFTISLKRVGSPTGFLTGRFWDNGIAGPGVNHNCIPNNLGWTDSSSPTVDLSTVPTAYTTYTFNLNAPVTPNFQYAVGIWLTCSPACNGANYVTAGISNTAPANQNAADFNANAGWTCADSTGNVCPTTWDYQFSVFFGFTCAPGYQCQNTALSSTNLLGLQANSTNPGVALTKSPIDVSTASAKELFMYETWHNTTVIAAAKPWGWYLTTNSTFPSQANYFPLNDTNVVLANIVYPNAAGTSKNYYEYMAKTGGTQSSPNQNLLSSSGAGTNPYPNCPQTSTLYMCAGNEQGASSTNFFAISTTLNFTGTGANTANGGYSLLCVDTTPSTNPPTSAFCSSSTQTPTISSCTTGQVICATTTLPFFNMQSGPYYLGLWSSAGQSATIQFGTSNSGAAAQRANSIWYWVPNPPPQASPPATISESGFFGPLVKALLGIGVWIVSNTISFITWLAGVVAPFLAATFTVLVGVFQAELNALGGFFGWGNIGDQFINFAAGIITYFTTGLSDALGWLIRLVLRAIDLIKIANFWVNFYLGGLLNILADGLNVIQFIVRIGTTITTFLGSSYVFLLCIIFLWYDADMGIAGWHAWFETVKWLAFISFDFLERMINFGISSITWIIGRIPTMDGTTLPELPTIAIGGGPIWPSMEMTALREGNVFALFGQLIGVTFLFWFETSGLPGSIGANVPAAPINSLAPFINLYLIIIAIMGLVFVLSIPATLMRKTFNLDGVPESFSSRVRSGVVATGSVSGRIVRKEKKLHIQINRGLGKRGLIPHLRRPKAKYTATVGPNIN
jgi:hypothetical protein